MSEIVWIPKSMRNETIEITKEEGYDFYDEYGNLIHSTKIVLEKKKNEYPKTYEECCGVLSIPLYYNLRYHTYERGYGEFATSNELLSLQDKLNLLGKLLICRDAYWKIAGDEMELGKPWEPDYTEESYEQGSPIKYVIYYTGTHITKGQKCTPSYILTFPTKEMRDAFKENFDPDLEICKELL